MTWTAIKHGRHRYQKRKFDKNFNKNVLKNHEKGQLLSNFRKIIHLWLSFRIMVDNFSHHQTWPPPLLKLEHLTKKMQKFYLKKSCKEPISTKLYGNNTVVLWLWFELPSSMAISVTKNRKFDKKINVKIL